MWILLKDNACPQVANDHDGTEWEILQNAAYFLNLLTSDYHLFCFIQHTVPS